MGPHSVYWEYTRWSTIVCLFIKDLQAESPTLHITDQWTENNIEETDSNGQ